MWPSLALFRLGLLTLLLGATSLWSPGAPPASAQHDADHAAGPSTAPRNAIEAQAAPGIVRLESFRFT